jgi:heparanase 1
MRAAFALLLLASCGPRPSPSVAIGAPVAEVSERFLSLAIDLAQVVGGHFWNPSGEIESGAGTLKIDPYDFSRPQVRAWAKELAPAFLRLGGSEADLVFYDLDGSEGPPSGYRSVLRRKQWDDAHAFARDLGFSIIFTLNAGPGPRDAEGRWVGDNARTLLTTGKPVALWELGNEINGFQAIHGAGFRVDGAQYADDVARARSVLDEALPGARLGGPSSAFWPVVGEMAPVMPEFMPRGGKHLDVVAWHYYPQQSRRCPMRLRLAGPEVMLEPKNLDEAARWAAHVEALASAHAPNVETWLAETGNAQCGGEPGVSDRFVGSLWWLDQLGQMARRGQKVVVRQTLSGSDYGLLDESTLEPRPDYWASVLWKRLMGTRALSVTSADLQLRAYAHCTRGRSGAATLLAINLGRDEVALPFAGAAYVVTAEALDSRGVKLSGADLTALDQLEPRAVQSLAIPARSYAFVVIPEEKCSQ